MKVYTKQKGDFDKLMRFLRKAIMSSKYDFLDKYGQAGVQALAAATPLDTGETASSWDYSIIETQHGATIEFHNSNVHNGVNIAIILEHGHGTRNGGWVAGRDYIDPTLQPIFDAITEEAYREALKEE